jgi:hypothetical protein
VAAHSAAKAPHARTGTSAQLPVTPPDPRKTPARIPLPAGVFEAGSPYGAWRGHADAIEAQGVNGLLLTDTLRDA